MSRLSFLLATLPLLHGCGERPAAPVQDQPAAPLERDVLDPATARWAQVEELRADLEAPRHESDGGGSARLVEVDGEPVVDGEQPTVVAATRASFVIEYSAGPEGIAPGGALYLMPEPFWGWSPPQNVDPRRLGFVRATTEAEGVELDTPPQRAPLFQIGVGGRALAEGEVVRIEYGVESGALTDLYAERGAHLWVSVDGDGDGVRSVLADSPTVDVLAGPQARIVATLTSIARPGAPVRAVCAVLDAGGSVVPEAVGIFELAGEALEATIEAPLEAEHRGARTFEFAAPKEGVHRLWARFTTDGDPAAETFVAMTNPLWVRADAEPLLWADLHGHSGLSDGTGTPEDYLRYARDVAGLDVIALTDHDHFGVRFLDQNPELWEGIQRDTRAFHEPGRFVTLLGYEWTSWIHGHRHVLFFGDEGEITSSILPASETPRQLWDALRGKQALTMAHHPAGAPIPVNWSFAPDPELEPLTEIMSVHGSSEAEDSPSTVRGARRGHYVRDALDRGYVLGFVGSGDSHDGHPGLPHLNPTYGYRPAGAVRSTRMGNGGLAAIRATPDRPSVLAAMRARQTWATSGPRILLETRLAGARGGERVAAADLDAQTGFDVEVVGTAHLARLDIVRSGEVVERLEVAGEWEARAVVVLTDLGAGEYVYLRVVQLDGGLAWSSPIFIGP